jgi:hypothetical protein
VSELSAYLAFWGFRVQYVMSDNSDDDIWARVRAEAAEKTGDRTGLNVKLEPSERTLGSLERTKSTAPTTKIAWETSEEEFDGPPKPKQKRRAKRAPVPTLLIGSTFVALLWVAAVGTLLIQDANKNGVDNASFLPNVLMLLLGPALALLAGFMAESVAKSNREARLLVGAARRMLEPEKAGEDAVRSTALAVRSEIGRLEGAIGDVADRLRLIETNVDNQTKALSAAGNDARGGADKLVASMEGERQRLDTLLAAMADLTAQAQTSTAMATQNIEDRAAKLAMAADSLVDKSTQASDVAAGAAQRLDAAALRAVSAIEQLDVAAGRGENALARAHDLMVLARLRADEAVGSVSGAVTSLNDAANSAAQTAQNMSQNIQAQTAASKDLSLAQIEEIRLATISSAQAMTEALRAEAQAARTAGDETMAALQVSAEAVRFAAEEARQQVNQQITDNQRRLDGVRQTAFEVGKDADAFVDKRMTDAKALIERSVGLLDDTGSKIQERFGRLAAACADQARAVEDLLDGLDRRLSSLPKEADARARAIEEALNETLARLTEAGRRAADETAALDNAFQDRLRDSYSALGEVVQRLGGLSGVVAMPMPALSPKLPPEPIKPPAPQPILSVEEIVPPTLAEPETTPIIESAAVEHAIKLPPIVRRAEAAPVNAISPAESQVAAKTTAIKPKAPLPVEERAEVATTPVEIKIPSQPTPQPFPSVSNTSRLKISSPVPIEDDPFAELQIGRAPPATSDAAGGWSWKQVLSTLDAKGAKAEATRVTSLVDELGLDIAISDKMLERLRAMASRSRDQARRGARELASDQVRAMRRKLTSDPDLRVSIVRFVEERREAAARGRLAGNEARVYLVADAALEA